MKKGLALIILLFVNIIHAATSGHIVFTGTERIVEGDPVDFVLTIKNIEKDFNFKDYLVGKYIADSLYVSDVMDSKNEGSNTQLLLRGVFVKSADLNNVWNVEGYGDINLTMAPVQFEKYHSSMEELQQRGITILDQYYSDPIKWGMILLTILIALIVLFPFVRRFLKAYLIKKKMLFKIKNELNEIEKMLSVAKSRKEIEATSLRIKNSTLIQKTEEIKSYLGDLDKIQFKKNWTEEELRLFLDNLKRIRVKNGI